MTDEEIKTKRLTDWKPETDIKLQKAFGKFVEEGGELLEAIDLYRFSHDNDSDIQSKRGLEDELADCDAVTVMIQTAAGLDFNSYTEVEQSCYDLLVNDPNITQSSMLPALTRQLSKMLSIVGRCQIQGLAGKQPDSGNPNRNILTFEICILRAVIRLTVKVQSLDADRIRNRKQAKIDSKLPWVMGTATDLLPDN